MNLTLWFTSLEILRAKKRWQNKLLETKAKELGEAEARAASQPTPASNKKNPGKKQQPPKEEETRLFCSSASFGVLTNDLLNIMQHSSELGFTASPIDDDVYH